MPLRKDETIQRVLSGGHPRTCTCVCCTKKRLRRIRGYPKWFWLIAILLPPIGSIIVGFVAGFRYYRWVAGIFMMLIGVAIAWFAYTAYSEGNLWGLMEF